MSLANLAETNTGKSFGSRQYRNYVLITLTVIYTFNFLDRILISVLSRPIIEEFSLTNLQFGVLSGIGFALFYTSLGIPIARLSERVSRVKIIGLCAILWSVATILCGFTVGFYTLLLARLAVGVGEAGCTPPANSLISDYYERDTRPVALGVYAMGVMVGGTLAQLGGGYILNEFTWREAFIYIGAPGVFVGILLMLTVKEPPRGYSDPPGSQTTERATFRQALKEMSTKPSFWFVCFGTSMATFGGYGLVSFKSLYIQYTFGLSPGDAAIKYMAPIYLAGAIGTPFAGLLIKKFSPSYVRSTLWVPAFSFSISAPLLILAYLTDSIVMMLFWFFIAGFFQYFYVGAAFNTVQSVVNLNVRATAIAMLLFIMNLIGYGAGPPFVGAIADFQTANWIEATGMVESLSVNCNPRDSLLSAELATKCVEAKAYGMRWASICGAAILFLASAFYLIAARFYLRDRVV